MKLTILLLGQTKDQFIAEGIERYQKRIRNYLPLELVEINTRKIKSKDERTVIAAEHQLLEQSINQKSYRIALDQTGVMLDSVMFSQRLQKLEMNGVKVASFIIGGAFGLAEEQKEKADLLLSLSKMTFTHDLARLLLLEQIYRSCTIVSGEKYHK
ncbi:MAG: 23S rRNA (pseudouridine(1915)-N(3))-methyltransferase RlmH [Desulfobulbaceae bacterium]|nr:MAG: 23S rRNA (pseudouridine(1915)-N(3))-methyltransferase RlmH [Desulfobulbaceae bacterium]